MMPGFSDISHTGLPDLPLPFRMTDQDKAAAARWTEPLNNTASSVFCFSFQGFLRLTNGIAFRGLREILRESPSLFEVVITCLLTRLPRSILLRWNISPSSPNTSKTFRA
jgi:hypothetical protein